MAILITFGHQVLFVKQKKKSQAKCSDMNGNGFSSQLDDAILWPGEAHWGSHHWPCQPDSTLLQEGQGVNFGEFRQVPVVSGSFGRSVETNQIHIVGSFWWHFLWSDGSSSATGVREKPGSARCTTRPAYQKVKRCSPSMQAEKKKGDSSFFLCVDDRLNAHIDLN